MFQKALPLFPKSSGDFDADGKADIGIYRDGSWYILRSSDALVISVRLGNRAGHTGTGGL